MPWRASAAPGLGSGLQGLHEGQEGRHWATQLESSALESSWHELGTLDKPGSVNSGG